MQQLNHEIDAFLASVERRGYLMSEIATGTPEDALDLVQDTMIAFVRRYSARSAEEWPPLFFRILQNRIRDWYRWNKVRAKWRVRIDGNDTNPGQQRAAIENHPGTGVDDPLQKLTDYDFGEALNESLGNLPLRQQQAFMLRTWEGLSVIETAQAMGCSQGSVKTHLSRATKALRQQLEDFK